MPSPSSRRRPSRRTASPLAASLLALLGCAIAPLDALDAPPRVPYDSGGEISAEQAAYDVLAYDLSIEVLPDERAIRASCIVRARIGSPLGALVVDLDPKLDVTRVSTGEREASRALEFVRDAGTVRVDLGRTRQPGDVVEVEISYRGRPRVAPQPPWSGGFTWAETPSGAPWIATTCQVEGADVWWPVKDHVSDEPDEMWIRVTAPDPLVVASNGHLDRREPLEGNRTRWHWHVSQPINAYNVALNIAPYEVLETTYESVGGETVPVFFWVLPESVESGRALLPEILDHLAFFEEALGPYPFRADKYGVAQTPHLGMEHQSIIAYGADFEPGAITHGKDWGFDSLHHHELSHEWWGNLVTNADWADMWLHEGFGTYMQPLYLERRYGRDRYLGYLRSMRSRIGNREPLAPRRSLTSKEVYSGDIYFKGAWVLHSLRWLLGDDAFFLALRRMAYPTAELERVTDGSQCRFAVTDDFLRIAEDVSGRDLDWLFEVYVRRAPLPRLEAEVIGGELRLEWTTVDELAFPMPVEVRLGDALIRVEMPDGRGRVEIPEGIEPEIDPDDWLLRADDRA